MPEISQVQPSTSLTYGAQARAANQVQAGTPPAAPQSGGTQLTRYQSGFDGMVGGQPLVAGQAGPVSGQVTGPSAGISGSMSVTVGATSIDANASIDVNATALSATGELTQEIRFGDFTLRVRLAGEGLVGATGRLGLRVHLGTDGPQITLDASGFAGARAGITGSVELVGPGGRRLMGGSLTGTAYAGIAGEAGFSAGFQNGNIRFHARAAASVGAGVGIRLAGEINPANIAYVAGHYGRQTLQTAWSTAQSTFTNVAGYVARDVGGSIQAVRTGTSVAPWSPNARWWFGLRNPFGHRN